MADKEMQYPIHWHHVFELVLTKPGQVLPLIRRAVDDFLWLLNRSWTGEAPREQLGNLNLLLHAYKLLAPEERECKTLSPCVDKIYLEHREEGVFLKIEGNCRFLTQYIHERCGEFPEEEPYPGPDPEETAEEGTENAL